MLVLLVMFSYVMSCHVMYVILSYLILSHLISSHLMLCYVMLFYVMLCYVCIYRDYNTPNMVVFKLSLKEKGKHQCQEKYWNLNHLNEPDEQPYGFKTW